VGDVIARLKALLEGSSPIHDRPDLRAPRRFPPATEASIEEAEAGLGFSLPPLLRRIYLEVGNGGFGPSDGLIGVSGGAVTYAHHYDIVEWYNEVHQTFPEASWWTWPKHLVPLIDVGCNIMLCVDCSDPLGPVIDFDPNVMEEGDIWSGFRSLYPSIES
jgi:hypothetical protein